jgi:hypothetical protein
MGIFSYLFRSIFKNSGSSVRFVGRNARRTFAPYPKRANPQSNRSTGNTSRYKRF